MDYTPQELALAVRKIIENHPGNWNQMIWYGSRDMNVPVDVIRRELEEDICGSAACVAGWAVILSSPAGTTFIAEMNDDYIFRVIYPDGKTEPICAVAQSALRLTEDQAAWLFNSSRTEEEVVAALTVIENGFNLDDLLPADVYPVPIPEVSW